jgi:hypothetical protein
MHMHALSKAQLQQRLKHGTCQICTVSQQTGEALHHRRIQSPTVKPSISRLNCVMFHTLRCCWLYLLLAVPVPKSPICSQKLGADDVEEFR